MKTYQILINHQIYVIYDLSTFLSESICYSVTVILRCIA